MFRGVFIEGWFDQADSPKFWIGMITVSSACTEVIVMYFGERLLRRFKGLFQSLLLTLRLLLADKNVLLAISVGICAARMWIFYLIPQRPEWIYFLFSVETVLRGMILCHSS